MSRDGFLPRALQGKEGKPPIGAVVLQGAIALFLVFSYKLQEVLNNVGAILTLFSALTVFSLFWICIRRKGYEKPAAAALMAAFCYLLLSGVMLYFGFKQSPSLNRLLSYQKKNRDPERACSDPGRSSDPLLARHTAPPYAAQLCGARTPS
jgi:amino acid transporter